MGTENRRPGGGQSQTSNGPGCEPDPGQRQEASEHRGRLWPVGGDGVPGFQRSRRERYGQTRADSALLRLHGGKHQVRQVPAGEVRGGGQVGGRLDGRTDGRTQDGLTPL
ncbi:unnamed protein product [Tetraodon nigroviridis]|uniref:(spotted green pufferfish) hypothetical protein n=1 Tax=Tetraodon nigroviridis TaxID=99883 RepID=Q4SAC3_TETNG|nr:unnamed protein product [Tetraodon nigroviridis]